MKIMLVFCAILAYDIAIQKNVNYIRGALAREKRGT